MQIEQMLGIHHETLRYWHSTGFFSPSVPRHNLRYNFLDICVLASIVKMKEVGLSVQRMRKRQLPDLKEKLAQALGDGHDLKDLSFTLISTKKHVLLFVGGGLYSQWEPEFTLNFGELWEKLVALRISVSRDGDTLEV